MMTIEPLYQAMARAAGARLNCIESGNSEWQARHKESLLRLTKDYLPSGSGFDSGAKIDLDQSTDERLVFTTAFHHMNDSGMYNGWTEHTVTVTPSLSHGFMLKVSGRDRNSIKDYIADCFRFVLSETSWWYREEYLRQVETRPEIKITSEWKDSCKQVWHCCGKDFKSFVDATRYAVEWLETAPASALVS